MNGVLLASYGSAAGLGDIERYLEHILHKPPTVEQAASLRERYAALGGRTPLHATTQRQAELLGRELGAEWVVEVGMKHSPPFIADAARALLAKGARRGVVLPLAAHDSRMSVGGYLEAARAGLGEDAPRFGQVRGFATHPLLIDAWVERVRAGLAGLPPGARGDAVVLFTAHSLPNKVLEWNDPYPGQVRATCEGVARLAGLPRWEQCYQSSVGSDWLGPDVLDAVDALAARGTQGLVVAPIGFVSDHLETLYDLDVEAAQRARQRGMAFVRAPAMNEDPRFIQMLADVARAHAPPV